MRMPTTTSGHGHVAADDALAEHGHESGLRRGQGGAAEVVSLVENHQREEEHERGDDDAEHVADLHLGRRAAEDVSDLEVLQHFAGDGRGDADHGGDAEHRRHAAGAADAEGDHQQRGDDQRAEREAGDGVVGGADHADQVAGDGGEEEAENDHDDGGDDGAGHDLAARHVARAGDEEAVERDHGDEHDSRRPGTRPWR